MEVTPKISSVGHPFRVSPPSPSPKGSSGCLAQLKASRLLDVDPRTLDALYPDRRTAFPSRKDLLDALFASDLVDGLADALVAALPGVAGLHSGSAMGVSVEHCSADKAWDRLGVAVASAAGFLAVGFFAAGWATRPRTHRQRRYCPRGATASI